MVFANERANRAATRAPGAEFAVGAPDLALTKRGGLICAKGKKFSTNLVTGIAALRCPLR